MQPQPQTQPQPSAPPPMMLNITTQQIQKYLDDNKQLIMAILEYQNQGKFAECTRYQAQLQQNLMFLASIADIQPQGTTAPSQMLPQASVQQEHYVQPSQAAMPQRSMHFAPKPLPLQLDDQQQQQLPSLLQHHHQQQQLIQGKKVGLGGSKNN
uniref:Uncharacterized protein MANES_01G041400 n=1 Tax=Rhizophora mucronata TaxID=61149 RepID=A0A2P2MUK4_RHIMU